VAVYTLIFSRAHSQSAFQDQTGADSIARADIISEQENRIPIAKDDSSKASEGGQSDRGPEEK